MSFAFWQTDQDSFHFSGHTRLAGEAGRSKSGVTVEMKYPLKKRLPTSKAGNDRSRFSQLSNGF